MVTGRQVGGYEILEELGRGAMGVVFKARQISMDRIVAIKFLPKKLAQDERIVARFLREARAAGQLAHPNIVSVHELGLADGLHFIAMEYVDGNSIQKKIKDKGAYSEKETLDISVQIAEALKLAHARGILHRDIKPDNFLIDSAGRVRLADLGLALIESNSDAGLTQDGTTLGTPHFMSPEQCSGTTLDARSDLYSLGASMFVMATGRTPYEGNTGAAVMVKVLTEPPQPLKKLRPDLSSGFIALVETMMHKDPAKRFQDAQSAVEAIQACMAGQYRPQTSQRSWIPSKSATAKSTAAGLKDQSGTAEKLGTRATRTSDSKLMPLALGGLAAVLFLAILFFMSRGKTQQPQQTGQQVALNLVPNSASQTKAVSTTAKTVVTPTTAAVETTSPVIAVKPAEATKAGSAPLIERHPELRVEMLAISADFQKGKLKPAEALKKLKDFRAENEKRLNNIEWARKIWTRIEGDVQAKLKLVSEDWHKLEPLVDADLKEGRAADALGKLNDFKTENDGTAEADKAAERVDAICTGVMAAAEKAASAGNFKEARALLSINAKLPENQDVCFKTAIAEYEEQIKIHQELADCYSRASQRALYYDPVPKTCFQFLDAAKYCTDYAAKAHYETNRKDILDMAELFKAADRVFLSLRSQLASQPVDLPSISNFKNVKVTQWDEKGFTFVPDSFRQPQPFTWEQATAPDVVFQVAKELKKSELDKPSAQWDLGVLAFGLGNQAAAGKYVREAVAKEDSPPRAHASIALKLFKPVDTATAKADKTDKPESAVPAPSVAATSLEDDAKASFKEWQDAKKSDSKEKAKALKSEFETKFAPTEFAKSHKKEIDELAGTPLLVAAADTPKLLDPPKAPEKTKSVPLPPDEEKAHEFLKLGGWVDIVGTWAWDKANNAVRVETVAEVANPAVEGDVSVRFRLLDATSKIRVLTRVDKSTVVDRFAGFGGKTSLGFGADVSSDRVYVYMDYNTKVRSTKDPVLYQEVKLDSRPIHSVDLSIHGTKMVVFFDDKPYTSAGDAHTTGDTRILVSGPALLYVAKVSKTK